MVDSSFWVGKRVIVTGHNGFKGSWLTTWLLKMGAAVKGISLSKDQSNRIEEITPRMAAEIAKEDSLFESISLDIRERAALRDEISRFRPDIVFHLAAKALVLESYDDPASTWESNVAGTINVLESVRSLEHKACCLVITTDKVYENKSWEYPYRENDSIGGAADPYSASKAAVELAVDCWNRSYFQNNSRIDHKKVVCTARAGNVIGGGDWSKNRLIPDMLRAQESGMSLFIRNRNSSRPWQHVLEPIAGYLMYVQKMYSCLEDGAVELPRALNFGPQCGKEITVGDMVQLFSKKMDSPPAIVYEESHYAEANRLELDSALALKTLGWKNILNPEEIADMTTAWHEDLRKGASSLKLCIRDIEYYESITNGDE